MLNKKDLYIYKEVVPLKYTDTNKDTVQIGILINKYEVRKYIDVQNFTETDCYIVDCTQRIILPNQNAYNPNSGSNSFNNYPALLTNNINITSSNDAIANCYLVEYNPKTLNTNVTTDSSTSDSSGANYSQQYASGSTTSQTNSYGGSANFGFFGDSLQGGISANMEHSSTTGQENSTSNGRTTSSDVQKANSDSMSIKDWGSYAIIDNKNQSPTWVWGQEYPWNIIQFNSTDSGNVILPKWVQQRLYDASDSDSSNLLYPPSQLSLFGINFVSKASWLVQMSNTVYASTITFNHTINYNTASHSLSNGALNATITSVLNPFTSSSIALDLALLALDSMNSGVATGFTLSQFTVAPTTTTTPFEIASRPNNLLIRGVGFSETMSVDFSENTSLDIYFKITDKEIYTLFLKCWKTADVNCILTITINSTIVNGVITPNSGTTIIKNVNDSEFEGGDNNMISTNLRNNDFTSAEYYDYLQYGLNHINIAITSDTSDTSAAKGFQLRTLAIGKG